VIIGRYDTAAFKVKAYSPKQHGRNQRYGFPINFCGGIQTSHDDSILARLKQTLVIYPFNSQVVRVQSLEIAQQPKADSHVRYDQNCAQYNNNEQHGGPCCGKHLTSPFDWFG
jgi:hypothetical protein